MSPIYSTRIVRSLKSFSYIVSGFNQHKQVNSMQIWCFNILQIFPNSRKCIALNTFTHWVSKLSSFPIYSKNGFYEKLMCAEMSTEWMDTKLSVAVSKSIHSTGQVSSKPGKVRHQSGTYSPEEYFWLSQLPTWGAACADNLQTASLCNEKRNKQ